MRKRKRERERGGGGGGGREGESMLEKREGMLTALCIYIITAGIF